MKKEFMDTDVGFALKLFGASILADILIIIMQFIFTAADELIGWFLSTFICIGVGFMTHITMIYSVAWQKGFRDIGLASRSLTEYKSTRGLLSGLMACVPGIILYLLLVIGFFVSDSFFNVIRIIFMYVYSYPFTLIGDLITSSAFALCIVFLIPLPLTAWMGYSFGFKNKLITKNIMYGKHASDEKIN